MRTERAAQGKGKEGDTIKEAQTKPRGEGERWDLRGGYFLVSEKHEQKRVSKSIYWLKRRDLWDLQAWG